MEGTYSPAIKAKVPMSHDDLAYRSNDGSYGHHHHKHSYFGPRPRKQSLSQMGEDAGIKPSRDNCDRRRPEEGEDASRLPNISQQSMGQSVTPFLREHIPGLYAPIGKPDLPSMLSLKTKDPSSKYCYRHRPDSKCRRAADESKMALIQSQLETLPAGDRQAITNVWSIFSAAPTKHRELMLQGIITQCCFPQLSTVSREVHEQLKIDFLSALPTELSLKILCYLDCSSLCKAAQVSRRWNTLSGDDVVWHRMCEQHIGRKCEKCHWGLPRLEKKRLKEWKIQHQADMENSRRAMVPSLATSRNYHGSLATSAAKRGAETLDDSNPAKRQCVKGLLECKEDVAQKTEEKKFRPWKDVYRDRYKVGSNWKYGRCTIKTFGGEHTNGVTCLQFDDNILATGSYDSTIKLWDIEKGEVIRTLQGHTMGIRALQFDDRMLVSGSLDGTVKIWNWRTGACINTLNHQGGVITVHMAGDYLASGSMDKSIKVFNFKTQQSYSLRGHADWVNQVRLDTASRTLLSASDDCTVKLWDLDTQVCIKTYEGHVGQVQQVLPLPDDFEFEDETIRESDTASVTSHRSTSPTLVASSAASSVHVDEERAAYGPIFQSDLERPLPPRYMLTGSLDATMRLWDTATGKSPRCFWGHVEGIWSVSADNLRYVSGSNDATVKIWEPRTGRCERTFTGHAGPVTCVGLSDSRMASGGEDGEVRLYSFEGEPSECEEIGTPC
ncbi:quinon protein alcohol dehydrogenase-like superfamily [Xylariomycetidae sp. FL0641]|nr:quinon protein alcohol dehydrogenase-like superfamily [Xylariomycetidae sp. FL0641]